ncbi:MAG: GNAT family N-acetyltransferase [Brevinematales bacterium]|nr:GNAT family N-acetyltransferase [Brevinematales bacterium]
MNISIRLATEEDIATILSLYKSLEEKDECISIDNAREIFNKMQKYPYHKVYVVEIENKIIGTFVLTILDYFAHNGKKAGILEDVVVDEKERSKGIGKIMLDFAIKECGKNNCYKLALSSNIKREKAHSFYEKNGFKLHGYSFWTEIKEG